MKKAFIFCGILITMIQTVSAQANKTNLSLQVSAAASANRAQLASYVWSRTVQVFVGGELKLTTVSSMAVGSDGKIVTTAVSSTPAEKLPGGIRGDIAKKKIADLKTYAEDGIKVSLSYLYMSKGKMVDFFDGATITQSGNTVTVKGSNVNKPKDQLTLNFTKGSYAYISQNFNSTVTNGDAVSGTINYQTFNNGLTAINNGELDLPAKNMKLMISNQNYAKKLQ
jgi:TRAP-type C4-dicarboxylate transport system substrate-binding protein